MMWQDAQAALFALAGIKKNETKSPSSKLSVENSHSSGESRWEFTNSLCTPTSTPLIETKKHVYTSDIDNISSSAVPSSSAAISVISEGIQNTNNSVIETPQTIEEVPHIRDKPRSGSEMSISSLLSNSNSLTTDGGNNEDCKDICIISESVISETGKKKSKKSKKKKSSTTSNSIEEVNEAKDSILKSILLKNGNKKRKNAIDRHIKWTRVELVEFSRAVGVSSVPNRGLYPLGLGQPLDGAGSQSQSQNISQSQSQCRSLTVDDHFLQQQERLRQRAASMNMPPAPSSPLTAPTRRKSLETPTNSSHSKPSSSNSSSSSGPAEASTAAKQGKKAPSAAPEHPATCFESRQFDFSPRSNPLFHPLDESARIALLGHTPHDAAALKDANRDIKAIQTSRTSFSCSCKPVKIDKLSVARMRSELLLLIQAGPHPPTAQPEETSLDSPSSPSSPSPSSSSSSPADWVAGLSKAGLTAALRQALKTCVLCAASNCECFQQGISCSGVGCPCQRRAESSSQSCANPFGHSVFNPDEVRAYRQRLLLKQRAGSL